MFRFVPFLWSVTIKAALTAAANRVVFRRTVAAAEPAFREWLGGMTGVGPEAVCREITERITYLVDPLHGLVDYVSAPALTWARRYGDCDDFAYLGAEVLTSLGYAAWIITYITWNLRASHTVCIVRVNCKYRVFDQELRPITFDTLGEAVDYTDALLPPVMTRYVRRYRGLVDIPGRIVGGLGARCER